MDFASENFALVGIVNPQTIANSEKLTGAIDMSLWEEVMAILAVGDMAAETIDFGAYASASSGGTYAAISGKAATQLAAHASNNDNKQIVINLKAEEVTAGSRYVKFRAITGDTTGGVGCVMVLGKKRYKPSSDSDLSSVVEIVR